MISKKPCFWDRFFYPPIKFSACHHIIPRCCDLSLTVFMFNEWQVFLLKASSNTYLSYMNTYVLGNMILTIYSLIKRNKDKSINCTNIQLGVPVLEYLQEYRWRITYRGRDALRPTASLKISYQHEWPLKKAATLGSLLQGLFIGSATTRRGPGKSWILRIYWKHEVYFLDLMSCSTPSLRECFNYEEIAIH